MKSYRKVEYEIILAYYNEMINYEEFFENKKSYINLIYVPASSIVTTLSFCVYANILSKNHPNLVPSFSADIDQHGA